MNENAGRYRAVQMHDYHKLSRELDDCLSQLEIYSEIISEEQASRLRLLVQEAQGEKSLDVTEVDRQYHLLLKMQKYILNDDGTLMDAAGLKEISTIVSSMGSVISLYLKARKDINVMKGEADLKAAVLEAVSGLEEAQREKFFSALESYKGKG